MLATKSYVERRLIDAYFHLLKEKESEILDLKQQIQNITHAVNGIQRYLGADFVCSMKKRG
jgi:hypothetical protein